MKSIMKKINYGLTFFLVIAIFTLSAVSQKIQKESEETNANVVNNKP